MLGSLVHCGLFYSDFFLRPAVRGPRFFLRPEVRGPRFFLLQCFMDRVSFFVQCFLDRVSFFVQYFVERVSFFGPRFLRRLMVRLFPDCYGPYGLSLFVCGGDIDIPTVGGRTVLVVGRP